VIRLSSTKLWLLDWVSGVENGLLKILKLQVFPKRGKGGDILELDDPSFRLLNIRTCQIL